MAGGGSGQSGGGASAAGGGDATGGGSDAPGGGGPAPVTLPEANVDLGAPAPTGCGCTQADSAILSLALLAFRRRRAT